MVSIIKPVYFQAKPAHSKPHSSHSKHSLIKYAEKKAATNMKDYSRGDIREGEDPLRSDEKAKLILTGFKLKREEKEIKMEQQHRTEQWVDGMATPEKEAPQKGSQQKRKGINIRA